MAKRRVYAVVDPADGTVVKEYPTATDEAVDGALDAAAKAYPHWSGQTSVAQRAWLLSTVADLHEERSAQLAGIIHREMGKPLDQAVAEVEFSASIYRYCAENAEEFLADEPIELLGGEGTALVRRRPIGVLHAGTFNANPIAPAAVEATMRVLADPAVYEQLEQTSSEFEALVGGALGSRPDFGRFNRVGSLLQYVPAGGATGLHGTGGLWTVILEGMLRQGFLFMPSGKVFLSTAHTTADGRGPRPAPEKVLTSGSAGFDSWTFGATPSGSLLSLPGPVDLIPGSPGTERHHPACCRCVPEETREHRTVRPRPAGPS
ncbi:aldehyde dehydrogenase family protein [Kitasatospora sp. NPDC096128]|uniref:aldehyde dehydrogenase family protein n=1 Tax=Kitasatospora sp. NPDC096128 TaxID=3155547 RepID=UPI003333171D